MAPNRLTVAILVLPKAQCFKVEMTAAWVTRCSHFFCSKCGDAAFDKTSTADCPFCKTPLLEEHDVFQTQLNPTEAMRSMALAGLMPETIMELATRGLAFFTFQCSLRSHLQEAQSKKQLVRMEETFQAHTVQVQADLSQAKAVARDSLQENEQLKEQVVAVRTTLQEKTRQLQRLQAMYDALRRQHHAGALSSQHEVSARDTTTSPTVGPKHPQPATISTSTTSRHSHPEHRVHIASHSLQASQPKRVRPTDLVQNQTIHQQQQQQQ
eukprot:m.293040 g.293040  ORF g.293040 m.293040 type:complete len:268 (-) comp15846_c0_seq17:3711-4514(-)